MDAYNKHFKQTSPLIEFELSKHLYNLAVCCLYLGNLYMKTINYKEGF